MSAIIQIQDVSFIYPDEVDQEKRVLNNINLTIEEGSFVAVLGHNGSGKSTLAKLLNGIHTPTDGSILVDGMDTRNSEHLFSIRSTVGMVFQNPDNQIVASVVEEDVAFAPENMGIPSPEIRERVDEALQMVGMYDFRLHAPHLLSGGQKQRIAVASVIAMRPRCIVLDESTAMLDPIGRREIMATAKHLNETFGMTIVLITHHMDEASLADRLIVMSEGQIIADDSPTTVFSQVETLKQAGLAVPDTVQLLYNLQQDGIETSLDALSDDACAKHLYTLLNNA